MRSQESGLSIKALKAAGEVAALTGVVAAAFLGKVGLKSAMAMPETKTPNVPEYVANISDRGPSVPKGVHVLQMDADIERENLMAYINLKHRWNVVAVLHAAKNTASVTFASSPSSYFPFETGIGFEFSDQKNAQEVYAPGFEVFKGRPYIAVAPKQSLQGYEQGSTQWGWGDVKWFMDNGSIDFYEYKGVKPGLVKFSPLDQNKPWLNNLENRPRPKDMSYAPDAAGHSHKLQLLNRKEVLQILNQLTHRN